IGSQVLIGVGIFLGGRRLLLELNRLQVGLDGFIEALALLARVGLLDGGIAIGIAQLGPDQVARSINLGGLGKAGNGSVEVSRLAGSAGSRQLRVQDLDGSVFLLDFGLFFLAPLGFLGAQAGALTAARGFLGQIETNRSAVQRYGDVSDAIELL